MFILERSLANSLVSLSPRLTVSAGVWEQLPLWAAHGGARPQPVLPPWLSAGPFCPPFIGRSIGSHLHPRGACCPCTCLVYLPFVCGMLVCVCHSLVHGSTASTHRDATCPLVSCPGALAPAKQGSLARLLLFSLWLTARKARGGVPPGGQRPAVISPPSFRKAPHSSFPLFVCVESSYQLQPGTLGSGAWVHALVSHLDVNAAPPCPPQ